MSTPSITPAFDRAFNLVIGAEGGYVDDPRDRGGKTKFGISQRAYPGLDIAALTIDDARAIYLKDYWHAANCDRLPEPVGIVLFDAAVNQGIRRATQCLQKALGVAADGVLGDRTIAAAHAAKPDDLVAKFLTERALHYASLPSFGDYGRGWMRRIFHLAREA